MSHQLIYTMGPSGAGKDSLLAWLKTKLHPQAPIHFARRTIDRPAQPGGELHESVDASTFQHLRDQGTFSMHWAANGLQYGVRHTELDGLRRDQWVMVNGSRAYLPHALLQFPGLTVLHITARAEVLRSRLLARQRENSAMVESRVQRAIAYETPPECRMLEIYNETSLDAAGLNLMQTLNRLEKWPSTIWACAPRLN
jgi:ribose 1,5-bisphosphokinase